MDTNKIFFSHSFQEKDKVINDYFRNIISGFDLSPVSVTQASSNTPPNRAKELITDSLFFIAIASKDKKSSDNEHDFQTRPSIQQEITMAYTLEKKILVFYEKGVIKEGFSNNFATYMEFERDKLDEKLCDIIKSIFNIICELRCGNRDIMSPKVLKKYFVENMNFLIRLIKRNDEYIWESEVSKIIHWTEIFDNHDAIRAGIFPAVNINTNLIPEGDKLDHSFTIINRDSDNFSVDVSIISESNVSIERRIKPIPKNSNTTSGVFEYISAVSSKYYNAITTQDKDILLKNKVCNYNEIDYYCLDGVFISGNTKKINIIFEFPLEYGLAENDFTFIVAGFEDAITYIANDEIKKYQNSVVRKKFAKTLIISIEIDNPFIHHIYGLLWNPPEDE